VAALDVSTMIRWAFDPLLVFQASRILLVKSNDNKYLKKYVHESQKDEMQLYHLIPTSRKLLVFFTSSGSHSDPLWPEHHNIHHKQLIVRGNTGLLMFGRTPN
jgi:hypothetical protein